MTLPNDALVRPVIELEASEQARNIPPSVTPLAVPGWEHVVADTDVITVREYKSTSSSDSQRTSGTAHIHQRRLPDVDHCNTRTSKLCACAILLRLCINVHYKKETHNINSIYSEWCDLPQIVSSETTGNMAPCIHCGPSLGAAKTPDITATMNNMEVKTCQGPCAL